MNKKAELHIEITKRCSLNCIHCSSNQYSNDTWTSRNFDKVYNFIEQNSSFFDFIVILTGGEPLAYKNISITIDCANKLHNVNSIGIFTSGCIVNNKHNLEEINLNQAIKLKKSGLTFCYVSLYSHIKSIHEEITKVKGSYDKTIKSINNFVRAGITTNINCPLTKLNAIKTTEFIEFCLYLKIKELRFLRLVRHGRAGDNWEQIGLTREEQKKVIKEILTENKQTEKNISISIAGFPEINNCRSLVSGRGCQAGKRLFYMDENGSIFPCASKKLDKKAELLSIKNGDRSLYNKSDHSSSDCKICAQDYIALESKGEE